MALIKVTNITTGETVSIKDRIIHPGKFENFDELTVDIQRMVDKELVSVEVIGDPSDIGTVGGFDSVREEIDELYARLNTDRQLNAKGFGTKGGG